MDGRLFCVVGKIKSTCRIAIVHSTTQKHTMPPHSQQTKKQPLFFEEICHFLLRNSLSYQNFLEKFQALHRKHTDFLERSEEEL